MRCCFLAALLGLCLSVPAVSAEAGPAHLVADLNPGTVPWSSDNSSFFHAFTRLGDRVVFLSNLANDVQCGLWATDGTAGGIERLADLTSWPRMATSSSPRSTASTAASCGRCPWSPGHESGFPLAKSFFLV